MKLIKVFKLYMWFRSLRWEHNWKQHFYVQRSKFYELILPDEYIYFSDINIVQLFHGTFDFWFVSTNINNKHKSIVILDLFHGRFSSKWMFNDCKLIKLVCTRNWDTRVFGLPWQFQCFWEMELHWSADLSFSSWLYTLQHCFLCFVCWTFLCSFSTSFAFLRCKKKWKSIWQLF